MVPANIDNPHTIYAVATFESQTVLQDAMGDHALPATTAAVEECMACMWSPAEAQRIDKLHCALSVTRAIYHAAIELNPGLTLTQIQRRWMTKQMIDQRRDAHDAFVRGLMRRERAHAGFIQRTLVLERDVHKRALRTILARTSVILAHSEGCCILAHGRPVWHGGYDEALSAYDTA